MRPMSYEVNGTHNLMMVGVEKEINSEGSGGEGEKRQSGGGGITMMQAGGGGRHAGDGNVEVGGW